MTTRTGCTQTLLSSDYIFFFHQRNRVFDCLLFGQAALVFSEFIFNRMRQKKKKKGKKGRKKEIKEKEFVSWICALELAWKAGLEPDWSRRLSRKQRGRKTTAESGLAPRDLFERCDGWHTKELRCWRTLIRQQTWRIDDFWNLSHQLTEQLLLC